MITSVQSKEFSNVSGMVIIHVKGKRGSYIRFLSVSCEFKTCAVGHQNIKCSPDDPHVDDVRNTHCKIPFLFNGLQGALRYTQILQSINSKLLFLTQFSVPK